MSYSWFPRKRVFISFDYDHDRNYRYLLAALAKNTRSDIEFDDLTPSEIQTMNVGRIKAALAAKLAKATHELVVIGGYANSLHPNRALIGAPNWQHWEIEKAKELQKPLIAVKIVRTNPTPTPLLNAEASWAQSFTVAAIAQAIRAA